MASPISYADKLRNSQSSSPTEQPVDTTKVADVQEPPPTKEDALAEIEPPQELLEQTGEQFETSDGAETEDTCETAYEGDYDEYSDYGDGTEGCMPGGHFYSMPPMYATPPPEAAAMHGMMLMQQSMGAQSALLHYMQQQNNDLHSKLAKARAHIDGLQSELVVVVSVEQSKAKTAVGESVRRSRQLIAGAARGGHTLSKDTISRLCEYAGGSLKLCEHCVAFKNLYTSRVAGRTKVTEFFCPSCRKEINNGTKCGTTDCHSKCFVSPNGSIAPLCNVCAN